jgi:hypothetical protein
MLQGQLQVSAKKKINFGNIPFPKTKQEGAVQIFDFLVSRGVIKEPKLRFPGPRSKQKVKDRLTELKAAFKSEELLNPLKEIFEKAAPARKAAQAESKSKVYTFQDFVSQVYKMNVIT